MDELPKLPRGEGSFSYRKNGQIQFRKKIKDERVTVYGDTIQECIKKMKKREEEIREQEAYEHPTDTPVVALLQDAIEKWLLAYKRPQLKGRSYDTIEGTFLNQIKDTDLGRTSIKNISSTDIQIHLNRLMDEKSLSTTKKTFSLLNQFFAFYYAMDINHNPMNLVRMPKKQIIYDTNRPIVDEEEIVVLSDEEIERLTEELQKPYTPGKIGYSYGNMLLFIMWTFMRIGEILAIQYKDIDFDSNSVKVFKNYGKQKVRNGRESHYEWVLSTTKTKKGRRIVYLCDKAVRYLNEHLRQNYPNADPETFIFFSTQGNPMSDQFLNEMLSKALKRASINKHITVHGLRHTGISYFLRHGISVDVISEQAGHNDISTTNRIYYTILEEQKKDAFKNL